jgi:hypothetical protein
LIVKKVALVVAKGVLEYLPTLASELIVDEPSNDYFRILALNPHSYTLAVHGVLAAVHLSQVHIAVAVIDFDCLQGSAAH